MAEVHTKKGACAYPAHIGADAKVGVYKVMCQDTGAITASPPAPQTFGTMAAAQSAADLWVQQVGVKVV